MEAALAADFAAAAAAAEVFLLSRARLQLLRKLATSSSSPLPTAPGCVDSPGGGGRQDARLTAITTRGDIALSTANLTSPISTTSELPPAVCSSMMGTVARARAAAATRTTHATAAAAVMTAVQPSSAVSHSAPGEWVRSFSYTGWQHLAHQFAASGAWECSAF